VTRLNQLVRDCLESNFPLTWVGGEISNLTYAASGHVYFSLKDAQAQVRCVMWRSKVQTLGWRLENGQKIEARSLVSFYEPRGEFQLNVDAIRRAGQGDLFEQFTRLKAKLEAEGLFAAAGKRALPEHAQAIAIVTSPQAAALRDVLSTLRRRAPHIRVDLYPTPVQGEGAAQKIADALLIAGHSDCDAIILCRGGGSIEDLWSFNEEIVARAIRASQLPVVSGVGHETDFTIADFAADLRAPTPTAAAELLSPNREELLTRVRQLEMRLKRHVERDMAQRSQQLDWLAARLIHPAEKLARRQELVAQLAQRLRRATENRLSEARHQLATRQHALSVAKPRTDRSKERLRHLQLRLANASKAQIFHTSTKLNSLKLSLNQLDPLAVLKRGYAIAVNADGKAIRDARCLTPGESLKLTLNRGQADITVNRIVDTLEAD
jgi:exodeoxyribonuclease VII large subunit